MLVIKPTQFSWIILINILKMKNLFKVTVLLAVLMGSCNYEIIKQNFLIFTIIFYSFLRSIRIFKYVLFINKIIYEIFKIFLMFSDNLCFRLKLHAVNMRFTLIVSQYVHQNVESQYIANPRYVAVDANALMDTSEMPMIIALRMELVLKLNI